MEKRSPGMAVLSKPLAAAFLSVAAVFGPAQAEEVRFYTFSAPPYQIVDEAVGAEDKVTGLTVSTVVCAANGTDIQATVKAAPQRRAIEFLRNSQIDGYFAVDPSTALDQIASRTDPVSLEKWYLVSRSDSAPPENARIGAVSGSNEEAWLRSRGKAIFLTVRTPEQLIDLLKRKRIDQALMDQRVLESLNGTSDMTIEFVRYVPLHLYLSARFTRNHPSFISRFNRRIPECINGTFVLDEAEAARIRGLAYDLFQEIENRMSLIEAIKAGPNITSLAEILNLDAQWQALSPNAYSAMARQVADLPASSELHDWQAEHGTLITEVMLTDSIGALVAMSQLTSDFWQGDEPKFERHIRTDTRNMYVSPIRYDASTSRFQVTVSLPILQEGRWIPVGVLAMGLDVEQALTGENHVLYLTRSLPSASPGSSPP